MSELLLPFPNELSHLYLQGYLSCLCLHGLCHNSYNEIRNLSEKNAQDKRNNIARLTSQWR